MLESSVNTLPLNSINTPVIQPQPLLLIGHGTRDADGRQMFLDFASAYQDFDRSRPVIPCFLELTEPSIAEGVEQCLAAGYTEMTALPLLLFAARHSKFDVTNELDRIRQQHPEIKYRYGRHLGITPLLVELWRDRLATFDRSDRNPDRISREDTVILFVGRGSSDPDANSDVCKLARILWEGSGYKTVEVCFIGITHPRLEEGFRRAMFYQPKRIIVLPYFLFTGALVKKIFAVSERMRSEYISHSDLLEIVNLDEIGIDPILFEILRDREIEAQQGEVKMNCEMCKFRLAALSSHGDSGHHHHHHGESHSHAHHHSHEHSHEHSHDREGDREHSHHSHEHIHTHRDREGHESGHSHDRESNGDVGIMWQDIYTDPDTYHARAWQVP
ncbi:sirohydrochlorin chelatase [Pseudanabaena sp. PCC 6802]|uniref:sirohydrochlorin chelatase n=1 Tax=Pseudanabaena sp. PCC 6802 TaxID=118173 RepID=UPI00035DEC68|nr:sirohydrochlorin chelatase [Pseudanabaena sp. PCC 6802]